jgi:lipoprotein
MNRAAVLSTLSVFMTILLFACQERKPSAVQTEQQVTQRVLPLEFGLDFVRQSEAYSFVVSPHAYYDLI